MEQKIQVYLVDDDQAFNESLSWLLEDSGFICHQFHSAQSFSEFVEQNPINNIKSCIVTDMRMPDITGLQLIEQLHKKEITIPVIVITGHGDVSLAVESMRQGAAHFLEKPFNSEILIEQIKQIVNDPGCTLRNPDSAREKLRSLTTRERQVLDLVCEGKLNKTIADILGISIKTVELHRSRLSVKLNVRNIQDLIKLTLGYK